VVGLNNMFRSFVDNRTSIDSIFLHPDRSDSSLLLAGMPHGFSTARAHRMDILRNFENRDLAVVHHSIARDSRNSYVYPSASPSRYENP
jgi:hypothetical protein